MGSFKKGDTLDKKRLKRFKYSLPEIGDGVYLTLRALSAPEVDEHIADGKDGPKEISGWKLLAMVAIDDAGETIFENEDDARKNLPVSAESMQGMVKKILELSGLANDKDRSKN